MPIVVRTFSVQVVQRVGLYGVIKVDMDMYYCMLLWAILCLTRATNVNSTTTIAPEKPKIVTPTTFSATSIPTTTPSKGLSTSTAVSSTSTYYKITSTTIKNISTNDQTGSAITLPSISATELTASTTLPSTSATELTTSTTLPSTSSKELTASTTLNSTSATELIASTTLPSTSATNLTASITLNSTSATELTTSTTRPSTSAKELTTSTTLPSTSATELTTSTTRPSTSAKELTASTTLPSTSATELTTSTTLPSTSATELTTSTTLPSKSATEQITPTTLKSTLSTSVTQQTTSTTLTSTSNTEETVSTTVSSTSDTVKKAPTTMPSTSGTEETALTTSGRVSEASSTMSTASPIVSIASTTVHTSSTSTASTTASLSMLTSFSSEQSTSSIVKTISTSAAISSNMTSTTFTEATTEVLRVSETISCGNKMRLLNGYVDYSNGTKVHSIAVFGCDVGFEMVPKNNTPSECLPNGKWRYTIPYCEIKDCGSPKNITNGYYSLTNGTVFGSVLFYHCEKGYKIKGKSRLSCEQDGKWTGEQPECLEVMPDTTQISCMQNRDHRGYLWPETNEGEVASVPCSGTPNGKDLSGLVERQCGEDGVWKLPKYDCVSKELKGIENQIKELKVNPSNETLESALNNLTSITNVSEKTGALYEGELNTVTDILETIAKVSNKINVSESQSEAFIGTASNLLDTTNQNSWQALSETGTDVKEKKPTGATRVLEVIDQYASAIATTVTTTGKSRTITKKNVVLYVSPLNNQGKQTGIHFPCALINTSTKSSISLGTQNLKDASSYSAVLYKNMTGILPPTTDTSKTSTKFELNSAVLSLDLHQQGTHSQDKLDVTIVLEHFQKELRYPRCSFWNTKRYIWDSSGCSLQSSNSTISVCKCSHLTNFAVLMSPWTEDNVDSTAIDVISIVGCSVSLIGLIITIVFHVALWRYLKSDRIVILMNLSVALVISYIIFLAGIDKTENRGACTAVAVLLQYIYLVVFFLMLAEGIELAVTILYVFSTKSRIKWMLPLAWGIPVVIVGISVGATETEGYGTDTFCWLSVEDGLIWSFVGPALLIILINLILLVLVMRTMFKARTLSQKSAAEKVKTGVRSLCILLPLMGCSWVLGIFYVNNSFSWVQYVFAVCNSLQGLVIFIFHCTMNTQIRGALQRRKKKYYDSRSMISSTAKNISLPRKSSTINGNSRIPISSITSLDSYDDFSNIRNEYFEMNNSAYMRESFSL